jgi:3-isopropylmalate dehydrogenase
MKQKRTIAVLPGDGIGPEVTAAATHLLQDCAREFGHRFELVELPIGGAAIDRTGSPLPAETLKGCRRADAVLLGAVGGPKWEGLPLGRRPEAGLLELRRALELSINVRPTRLRDAPLHACPLRPERARHVDFEIVRELAGGIYFGKRDCRVENGREIAYDTETYSTEEIERVARFAFTRALERGRRLTSVDKANVLATSGLWRRTVTRLAADYPEIQLEHLYVDSAALQIILQPERFDVMVTSNLFGDILSDEAAALTGSIGLVPSMSLGTGPALYEPIHGSAPQLAGKDCACPIGAILSAAMMLRESFGLRREADWIEAAVNRALALGYRTADIAEPQAQVVTGSAFADIVRRSMFETVQLAEGYGWGV